MYDENEQFEFESDPSDRVCVAGGPRPASCCGHRCNVRQSATPNNATRSRI